VGASRNLKVSWPFPPLSEQPLLAQPLFSSPFRQVRGCGLPIIFRPDPRKMAFFCPLFDMPFEKYSPFPRPSPSGIPCPSRRRQRFDCRSCIDRTSSAPSTMLASFGSIHTCNCLDANSQIGNFIPLPFFGALPFLLKNPRKTQFPTKKTQQPGHVVLYRFGWFFAHSNHDVRESGFGGLRRYQTSLVKKTKNTTPSFFKKIFGFPRVCGPRRSLFNDCMTAVRPVPLLVRQPLFIHGSNTEPGQTLPFISPPPDNMQVRQQRKTPAPFLGPTPSFFQVPVDTKRATRTSLTFFRRKSLFSGGVVFPSSLFSPPTIIGTLCVSTN